MSGRTYRVCGCGCGISHHVEENIAAPDEMPVENRSRRVWIGCIEKWRAENPRKFIFAHEYEQPASVMEDAA